MPSTGVAIHIGLNGLDPDAYAGWPGILDACENDARELAKITAELDYESTILLTEDATVDRVFGAINDAGRALGQHGIIVITYAGHGAQFRDLSGDEPDARDETWCLFDREILDDEIYQELSSLDSGIRVVVISDSCHSGTVVRNRYLGYLEQPDIRDSYNVAPNLRLRKRARDGVGPAIRMVPEVVQAKILADNRQFYARVRAETSLRAAESMAASVLLLAACQDNQAALEDGGHGVFTAALLDAWDAGRFTGDYRKLHRVVRDALPPTQSPNYLAVGRSWPEFERQTPFTTAAPGGSETGPTPGSTQTGMKLRVNLEIEPNDPAAEEFFRVLRTVAEFDTSSGSGRSSKRSAPAPERADALSAIRAMHASGKYSPQELSEIFSIPVARIRKLLEKR